MSFPRYERYKDSDVEWLGEVPEHWEVSRLKLIADVFPSNVDKKEYEDEVPVRLCNYTDVYYNDVITDSMELMRATATPQQVEKFTLRAGDTILTKDSETADDIAIAAYVPGDLPGVVCGYHLSIARPKPVVIGAFIKRVFDAAYIRAQAEVAANGLTRVGLSQYALDNLLVSYPTPDAQFQIVQFLDQETAKIDALIEEQRRLIELLKEKRQAIISHAVLTPTGTQTQLRHHVIRIEQGWSPIAADRDPEPGEWAVLKLSAVKRGEFDATKLKALPPDVEVPLNLELRAGDFLVTRANTPDLVGDSCYVASPPTQLIFSDLIYRLVLNGKTMLGEFLNLALQSALGRSQAKRDARGSSQSMVKLGHDQILSWMVPALPLCEQKQIVEVVRQSTDELSRAVDTCRQAISLLEERRSALISAAVTGKIDVRAYTAKAVLSVTPYSSGFAHQLLAAEILDRYNDQRMGRIKLQKLIHLCEYHGQVKEIQGDYTRKAAGPFDAKAMAGIRSGLKKQKWFEEVREGERYVYRPLEKRGEHKKYLSHWQAEMPRIDEVLSLLGNFKTRECEIVSTLYAAWNDLLIDGGSTDDAAILHEASSAERWHKSKEQIAPERWKKALLWMKDKGLIPIGFGKHTRSAAEQIEQDA